MMSTSSTEHKETLEKDAKFMDKYSRQIGAYGMETMAKVFQTAPLAHAQLRESFSDCDPFMVACKAACIDCRDEGCGDRSSEEFNIGRAWGCDHS